MKDLSAKEASELKDVTIIDVRTPGEFNAGHLKGAKLIDIMDPDFNEIISGLDRKKSYLVYCRTGSRSRHAVNLMQQLGFENIYHMKNGIMDWEAEGLPVEQ